MEYRKKLIEVALPLEAINAHSAREKSIRHGHPSTLHLWWARRPLAAARAVIFTSLIDDPDQDGVPQELLDKIDALPLTEKYAPDKNATIGEVRRQKLFAFIDLLVKWENSNNTDIVKTAQELILAATDGNPPPLLDPFAGGGAIPLEAQRLGLEAHASDLNPVAVMINKAMIEIPPKFAGQPPVNPESRQQLNQAWTGAQGLAEDVRYYGKWMKQKAFERIGHLYPKVKDEQGNEHTIIAWIWARTVKCPNPACGCEMPLVRSFNISKKKSAEFYVEPSINNNEVVYEVRAGTSQVDGTVERRGAKCYFCETPVGFPYIRDEGKSKRLSARLIGVVAESSKNRIFLSPDEEQLNVSMISKPIEYPDASLPKNPRDFKTPNYGMGNYSDLFTNRQLVALTTLSDIVTSDLRLKVINDGGSEEYANAISVFLSFVVDKQANYCSSNNGWSGEFIIQVFGRQAIPMVWDYAETNVFSNSTGCFSNMLEQLSNCLDRFPASSNAFVKQHDAQTDNGLRNIMISTDPPYYDNIGYADLSDYFYIWMRRMLKDVYPDLFRTVLVPKTEELVATPYRFDGSFYRAKVFFEDGMYKTFCQIYQYSAFDFPLTVYYAFKQSEAEAEYTASTGWETMLSAIIHAGFYVTGTWPMHTERETGLKDAMNSLASSIVLVCRKRPADAPICTRRDFINTLKRELKPALQKLQASNIAPVDLAQSAIGPGMGVYSRYSKVLEADGTPMSVRSALQIINQELDLYFTEQDGELDRDSSFCIELFKQSAFNDMKFGEADVLARAKNTSVDRLSGRGILYAQKGIVRLLTREEIPEKTDKEIVWLLTQQLTRAMEKNGVTGAAKIVADMLTSEPEHAKALAYRLFTIAERKGWAQEAFAYNSLVISWPEVQAKAAELAAQSNNVAQMTMFDKGSDSSAVEDDLIMVAESKRPYKGGK